MRNIGPVSRRWLAEIGVYSESDLHEVGSVKAYRMIKARNGKNGSLNLLWALEGAIQDIDWRDLSAEEKEALKNQVSS